MATYVNDLRLKEIATGDESGTWGTSTNTNLELIAEAFSYATQDCFTTDANATTTIADGATDPARSLYFKVTSSATLTATRTLTLAPNTVSKVWIIENATTGGQSITISQGSGTNVTIINGSTSVIYSDGGGASANIADAFFNLTLTGDLLVDDSTLYVDSSNNQVGIGTTSPQNQLHVAASSPSIRIEDTDGGYGLVSGLNGNVRLRADEGNTVASSFIGFEIDGTEEMRLDTTGLGIGTTSPAELLHVADTGTAGAVGLRAENSEGHVNFTTNGGGFQFETGASGTVAVIDSSGNVGIGTTSPQAPIHTEFSVSSPYSNTTNLSLSNSVRIQNTNNADSSYSMLQLAANNATGTTGWWNIAAISTSSNYDTELAFQTRTGSSTYAERLRIDTSGNLLVGQTTASDTTAGFYLSSAGRLSITRDGAFPLRLNRLTDSGQIIQLLIDSAEIGNLGSVGNDMYVGTGDTTLRFHDSDDDIRPANTTGSARDNEVDLGHAGAAFKDVYVGSGIYLTGTTSANYLDDYEEGAVTLTFRDESGNTTTGSSGAYTKIGRIVIFTGEEANVPVTGLVTTDNIQLDLPFTAGTGQTGDSVGTTWWQSVSNISNPERTIVMTVGDGASEVNFQQVYTSGTGVAVKVSDLNASGLSDLRRFCLVYHTPS